MKQESIAMDVPINNLANPEAVLPETVAIGSGPESFRAEVARVTRPIAVDIVVFSVILSALLIGFMGLRALAAIGFDRDRVQTLETMHYWCYTVVFGLFCLDLLYKVTLALFFRKEGVSK